MKKLFTPKQKAFIDQFNKNLASKPTENEIKFRSVAIKTLLFISVFFSLFYFGCGSDDKPEKKEPSQTIVFASAYDGSVYQVEDYLKNTLNDWDSYQNMEWSPLIKLGADTLHPSGYVIRNKYRAKSMLGGLIIKNEIFRLDSLGNISSVSDHL